MILNYLRKHPDAKDTLEGVMRWWLHFEKIESAVDEVSIALDSLIKKGVIESQSVNGDTPVYRISKND